jgi:hypothetical protein
MDLTVISRELIMRTLIALMLLSLVGTTALAQQKASVPFTVDNFIRAESDYYFASGVQRGSFGRLSHLREVAPIGFLRSPEIYLAQKLSLP